MISFISEAVIIRRILEHLGLWTGRTPMPPTSRAPLLNRERRYEPFDDGWAQQYEEPFVAV